jgi:hypothetical protein
VPTVALASTSQKGLVSQISGLTTDFIDGSNNCQDLASAVRSVIWSVRQRTFNSIGNPNFEIALRNPGGGVINSPAGGSFLLDRWTWGRVGSHQILSQQKSGAINWETYCALSSQSLLLGLTTIQATLAAGDYGYLVQNIEGPNTRGLMGNVSSISLFIQADAGMNCSITLRDSPVTTSWVHLCTLQSGFNLIKIPNIPAFPTGNFSAAPGALGYSLGICFGAGSTFTAPAADSWVSGNYLAAPGQTNWFAGNTSTNISLFFVQHEPGPDCGYLIEKSFTQNLDECQRYYSKSVDYGAQPTNGAWRAIGFYVSGGICRLNNVIFPVGMAKTPTVTFYDNSGTINQAFQDGVGGVLAINTGANAVQPNRCYQLTYSNTAPAGAVTGYPTLAAWKADTGW